MRDFRRNSWTCAWRGSLGDEHAVPSQGDIRGEQRADFLKTFATEDPTF